MTLSPFSPLFEVRNARHPAPIEPPQYRERYFVGLDLGQSNDPTAVCVVRRFEEIGVKPVFQVGHLARLPLGTPYPQIVSQAIDMTCRPEIRGRNELIIDYTGVGRPVFDIFRENGMSPIGVTITGGTAITNDGLIWSVPKGHIISRIQALLHEGRLKIHADLPDAPALVTELQSFRADFTDTGYIKFNARSGAHDDLVLALGIALWRAYGDQQNTGLIEYYQQLANGSISEAKHAGAKSLLNLKAPAGITHVNTITGRTIRVGNDNTIQLTLEEAGPLLRNGWLPLNAQKQTL